MTYTNKQTGEEVEMEENNIESTQSLPKNPTKMRSILTSEKARTITRENLNLLNSLS